MSRKKKMVPLQATLIWHDWSRICNTVLILLPLFFLTLPPLHLSVVRKLQVMKTAWPITGTQLTSINFNLWRVRGIIKDPSHPNHWLFPPFPFRKRCNSLRCRSSRLTEPTEPWTQNLNPALLSSTPLYLPSRHPCSTLHLPFIALFRTIYYLSSTCPPFPYTALFQSIPLLNLLPHVTGYCTGPLLYCHNTLIALNTYVYKLLLFVHLVRG